MPDGNAIVDERILVSIDEGNTVRVYKQTIPLRALLHAKLRAYTRTRKTTGSAN